MASSAILITRASAAPLATVWARLPAAVTAHKFGVMGEYDLRDKMVSKGVPFERECKVRWPTPLRLRGCSRLRFVCLQWILVVSETTVYRQPAPGLSVPIGQLAHWKSYPAPLPGSGSVQPTAGQPCFERIDGRGLHAAVPDLRIRAGRKDDPVDPQADPDVEDVRTPGGCIHRRGGGGVANRHYG